LSAAHRDSACYCQPHNKFGNYTNTNYLSHSYMECQSNTLSKCFSLYKCHACRGINAYNIWNIIKNSSTHSYNDCNGLLFSTAYMDRCHKFYFEFEKLHRDGILYWLGKYNKDGNRIRYIDRLTNFLQIILWLYND
jgi:hypothetical protein